MVSPLRYYYSTIPAVLSRGWNDYFHNPIGLHKLQIRTEKLQHMETFHKLQLCYF